jgi:predicted TIM-barrel fold metal-dependent hydrolase
MIVDAHCHVWRRWPYRPDVPDPARGNVAALLWEMDRTGVDRAVLICASIGGNDDNAAYAVDAAAQSGGRLAAFIDVDCRWHGTHQCPGAAERLHTSLGRFGPRGITHYMDEDGDASWLCSPDGLAFLKMAETHRLVLSLACGPAQMPQVCAAAASVPGLPILLHHCVRVRAGDTAGLEQVLAAASTPNLIVKLSGFGYGVDDGWDFPLPGMRAVVAALYAAYGADRLVWGSDWPVSTRYMTHRQTLELVRRHCTFITPPDLDAILGGTMAKLLA